MTTTKMLGPLGLIGGMAMGLMTAGPGPGCPPQRPLGSLTIFDKKDAFGYVVRDGDRFVALHFRKGEGIYLHNFDPSIELEVDDKYLGYDLRGKNKNVLARVSRRPAIRDIEWEFVSSAAKSPFLGYFRVKNGELKGWWIGLGPVERAKKEERPPFDRRPRAPLILVKDKEDAAGFRWSRPEKDDGR